MTNKVDQKTIRSHNLVQWVNEILHWYDKGYRPITKTIRNMGVQNSVVMEGVASATGDANVKETEVLVGLEADENLNKQGDSKEEVFTETQVEKPVKTETVETKQPVKTTRTKKTT